MFGAKALFVDDERLAKARFRFADIVVFQLRPTQHGVTGCDVRVAGTEAGHAGVHRLFGETLRLRIVALAELRLGIALQLLPALRVTQGNRLGTLGRRAGRIRGQASRGQNHACRGDTMPY